MLAANHEGIPGVVSGRLRVLPGAPDVLSHPIVSAWRIVVVSSSVCLWLSAGEVQTFSWGVIFRLVLCLPKFDDFDRCM